MRGCLSLLAVSRDGCIDVRTPPGSGIRLCMGDFVEQASKKQASSNRGSRSVCVCVCLYARRDRPTKICHTVALEMTVPASAREWRTLHAGGQGRVRGSVAGDRDMKRYEEIGQKEGSISANTMRCLASVLEGECATCSCGDNTLIVEFAAFICPATKASSVEPRV